MKPRVCARKKCTTILVDWNPGETCYAHTERHLADRREHARNKPGRRVLDLDELSPADKEAYNSGAWLA